MLPRRMPLAEAGRLVIEHARLARAAHVPRSPSSASGSRHGRRWGRGACCSVAGEPCRISEVDAAAGRPARGRVEVVPGGLVVRLGRDGRETAELLEAWLRERARERHRRARRGAGTRAGACEPGRISIRDQSSRWASASASGALSFSWRLLLAPPFVLDAVVVHELAHLRIRGHTRALLGARRATRSTHARGASLAPRPRRRAPRRPRLTPLCRPLARAEPPLARAEPPLARAEPRPYSPGGSLGQRRSVARHLTPTVGATAIRVPSHPWPGCNGEPASVRSPSDPSRGYRDRLTATAPASGYKIRRPLRGGSSPRRSARTISAVSAGNVERSASRWSRSTCRLCRVPATSSTTRSTPLSRAFASHLCCSAWRSCRRVSASMPIVPGPAR